MADTHRMKHKVVEEPENVDLRTKEKAKEFVALLPDDIKHLTSLHDIEEAIGRKEEVPIEYILLLFGQSNTIFIKSSSYFFQAATGTYQLQI